MRRAYIAAPWWHPSPLIREWNTARAELLARLAAAEGFEPVCVHRALMDAGVDDDADPEARARGLDRTCATIREIKAEGGAMYVLTTRRIWMSPGVVREVQAWIDAPSGDVPWLYGPWKEWRGAFKRAGLLPEWQALVVPPC